MKRQLSKIVRNDKACENEFELRTEDEKAKLVTIKRFDRRELREIYNQLELQKGQLRMNRANIVKQIDKITTKDTKELRDFARKIEGAQQLIQKSKLEAQLKQLNDDVELFSRQMREIKVAVPEVGRMPKK